MKPSHVLAMEILAHLKIGSYLQSGSGKKALFGRHLGVMACDPTDLKISTKWKWSVTKAMKIDLWVSQINVQNGISCGHIVIFYKLLEMISFVHIDQENLDADLLEASQQ
jgi:hypothetical protein